MNSLTSHQKIADLLLSLSPKDAANVIKPLNEIQLLFVGEAILKYAKSPVNKIGKDKEFLQDGFMEASTKDGKSFLRMTVNDFSEIEVVKALYRIAFGKNRAENLVAKLLQTRVNHQLSFLNQYTASHLHLVIAKESTSVISIVMGVVKPKISAQIIRLFDSQKRQEIIQAISVQQNPSEAVISIIERTLKSRLRKLVEEDEEKEKPEGEENLFHILEQLDSEQQDNILNSLEDKSMKERLEYRLLSWVELELLEQLEIEKVLEEFDNEDIARLILLDGIDAEVMLKSIISYGRMNFIQDELKLMQKDLMRRGKELQLAKQVKKRFFVLIKEYSQKTEKV